MRKSLIVLAALLPIVGLAGAAALTLPAMAESDDGACLALPAADVGPINLDAIPTKPVTGPLSVRGAGGDDCDDEMDGGRQRSHVGMDDDGEGGRDSDD